MTYTIVLSLCAAGIISLSFDALLLACALFCVAWMLI